MPFLQTVSHKHDTLGAGAFVMFLRAAAGNGTADLNQYWPDHFFIETDTLVQNPNDNNGQPFEHRKEEGRGFFVPERSQQIVCHNVLCFHIKWNCSAILTSLLFFSFCFKNRVIQSIWVPAGLNGYDVGKLFKSY